MIEKLRQLVVPVLTAVSGMVVVGTIGITVAVSEEETAPRMTPEEVDALPYYAEVPLSDMHPDDAALVQSEIDGMAGGGIPLPDGAMPPSEDVVLEHVVALDAMLPRLTFTPLTPSVSGFQLIGALEQPEEERTDPNDPTVTYPAAASSLTSVELVYQKTGSNGAPLVILSEEHLVGGDVKVQVAQEAINHVAYGYNAVFRRWLGDPSGAEWNEVTFYKDGLVTNVAGYAIEGVIKDFANVTAQEPSTTH